MVRKLVFYFAMNGIGWNEDAGWLSDDDYCIWFGVSCSNGLLDVFRIEGIYLGEFYCVC